MLGMEGSGRGGLGESEALILGSRKLGVGIVGSHHINGRVDQGCELVEREKDESDNWRRGHFGGSRTSDI